MAKKQSPVSGVLVDICMRKARREKPTADRWDFEIVRRLKKALKASHCADKPLLAVELSKLAGIALAAAEVAYSGGETC